jgi:hypothetical protein
MINLIGLAQDPLYSLNSGKLDPKLFEASHKRIDRLLLPAPPHSNHPLPENVLAGHGALRAQIDEY